jgi:hypothetical protein
MAVFREAGCFLENCIAVVLDFGIVIYFKEIDSMIQDLLWKKVLTLGLLLF